MKKLLLPVASLAYVCEHAQIYWQQEVHYNIYVSSNDSSHSLKGFKNSAYTTIDSPADDFESELDYAEVAIQMGLNNIFSLLHHKGGFN